MSLARFDNGYSRAIAVVKIVLPLVALGILSTLFLFSEPVQVGEPLPYSDLKVQEMAAEQRLGSPIYSGMTEDGAVVRIVAQSLRPDQTERGVVHGNDLVGKIIQPTGYTYDITSAEGTMNDVTREAELRGGVQVDTSDHYRITMPGAHMRTDLTYLESVGSVFVEGPIGTLEADSMVLTGNPNNGTEGVALFQGNVKLVYLPQRESGVE